MLLTASRLDARCSDRASGESRAVSTSISRLIIVLRRDGSPAKAIDHQGIIRASALLHSYLEFKRGNKYRMVRKHMKVAMSEQSDKHASRVPISNSETPPRRGYEETKKML
jgi:hypothetical protein